ncbi:LysR substrate-binding domain-containing protein, partial [Rhodococcus aetherivorans]
IRRPPRSTRTTHHSAPPRRSPDLVCARPPPLLARGRGAAVRTAALGGVGPAVLSTLAVADHLASGELRTVEVEGLDLARTLRAVWRPPRKLAGPAGDLVRMIVRGA